MCGCICVYQHTVYLCIFPSAQEPNEAILSVRGFPFSQNGDGGITAGAKPPAIFQWVGDTCVCAGYQAAWVWPRVWCPGACASKQACPGLPALNLTTESENLLNLKF